MHQISGSTMKVEIGDEDLKELYQTGKNRKGRYKRISKDGPFVEKLKNLLDLMVVTNVPSDLPGRYEYEKLKYQYSGLSSVRIVHNRVERLIFEEFDGGIRVNIIQLDESHYGKKK